jgi:hypothetical protein
MKKMYVNIIHRVDEDKDKNEAFCLQQNMVHELGLKSTILLTYQSMQNKQMMEYVKEQQECYKDEIGVHLEGIQCEAFQKKFGMDERALYLYSFEKKKLILTELFTTFYTIFNQYPTSVGSYYLDSQTLVWIHTNYPMIQGCIVSCFEEGVHMYSGNRNQWYLFSEGGPWGAYYPSTNNSFCPAFHKQEAIDIVALPHLNRDMLLALTSRDDYYSSHPANVIRGKVNDDDECPYMYRFIDEWMNQRECNDYVYYNIFVSPSWMVDGSNFEVPSAYARQMYKDCLKYLKYQVDQKNAVLCTMGEFALWYKENVNCGSAESVLWKDILCGSKRQMFWYADPSFRMAVDPNIGGSICDLRPYAGQVERNLGPDTVHLANGNYPFIISCEHRGGVNGGSIQTCKLHYQGKTVSLTDFRTQCHVTKLDKGQTILQLDPVEIILGDLELTLVSRFIFSNNGNVIIERNIIHMSDPNAEVVLEEYHRGSYGTTQYPEDMRGIGLGIVCNDPDDSKSITYGYGSDKHEGVGIKTYAVIPQLQTKVSLFALNENSIVRFEEGYLFRPFYTLQIKRQFRQGEGLRTCLRIEKK